MAAVNNPVATTPGTGVNTSNPLYTEFITDWKTMRDTYRGERIVKENGTIYLPATSGMIADGMETATSRGFQAYSAYRRRASFPDAVKEAVKAMVGVMHHKPPTIELPESMDPMRENATLRHESLEVLLRRINEEQLVTGRLGLLLDLPETVIRDTGVLPYIAFYDAERIINWDEGRRDGIVVDNLNLVVLDESEFERKKSFSWEYENKYRVLVLGDPLENEPVGEGIYKVGVFRDQNFTFSDDALVEPSLRGNTLDEIPFVFINAKDIVPQPDDPPLIGLANLALTIYRTDADYRQSLFMQGQDTLVVVGSAEEDDFRVGAGATIKLPIGGEASYIGVESKGLEEQRKALENDKAAAGQKGGQSLDSVSRERESGDALKIRVAARTATLNQVALAGAFGLQSILRTAATWAGADPEQVVVTPNLDFTADELGGEELTKLMTAKGLGAPISLLSIHEQMQDKDMTNLTFEEELDEIEKEAPLGGSEDPNGPEPDPDLEDEE